MSRGSVRVRFLMRKRYPHPNGPRRAIGDSLEMQSDLATQWAGNGVVEIIDEAPVLKEAQEAATISTAKEVPEQRDNPEASADNADNSSQDEAKAKPKAKPKRKAVSKAKK